MDAGAMAPNKTELIDLLWRSWWTFAAAFIGGLSAAGTGWVDTDMREIAIVSGLSVLTTVVKVYVSNKAGTGTASQRQEPVVSALPAPVASNSATPAQ